jgi:hypothetical protein
MSIVFAGGELGDFAISGEVFANTTTIYYSTAYARCSIEVNATGALTANFPSPPTWVSFRFRGSLDITTNNRSFLLLKSGGNNVMRIAATGANSTFRAERWNGTAWVQFGSNIVFSNITGGIRQFIVKCVTAASGSIDVYAREGASISNVASYSGDLSTLGDVTSAEFRSLSSDSAIRTYVSEIIAATHSLFDARLKTLNLTAAGASSEWTGALTSINGTGFNDANFISSDTAGQTSTYAAADLPTDSLFVDTVLVSGRMRRTEEGPQGAQGVVRVGSTNYTQNFPALGEAFGPRQALFGVDPSTSAPWTKTAVDALEIGIKSVE